MVCTPCTDVGNINTGSAISCAFALPIIPYIVFVVKWFYRNFPLFGFFAVLHKSQSEICVLFPIRFAAEWFCGFAASEPHLRPAYIVPQKSDSVKTKAWIFPKLTFAHTTVPRCYHTRYRYKNTDKRRILHLSVSCTLSEGCFRIGIGQSLKGLGIGIVDGILRAVGVEFRHDRLVFRL